jgi:hypothetical protein
MGASAFMVVAMLLLGSAVIIFLGWIERRIEHAEEKLRRHREMNPAEYKVVTQRVGGPDEKGEYTLGPKHVCYASRQAIYRLWRDDSVTQIDRVE